MTTDTIPIQYIPNGYLSMKQSDGVIVYVRYLSCSVRRNFWEILQHTPVTNDLQKQLSCQSKLIDYRAKC